MAAPLSMDGHKLWHHLDPVVRWVRNEPVHPLYCAISLAQSCNHRCIFCVYDYMERSKSYLEAGTIVRFVEELRDLGLKAAYFSGEGEPLMHPEAVEIIARIKALGVECALNTNGYYNTPEVNDALLHHLTYMRVSINGCDAENYKKIHGTSIRAYDRVLDNLKSAVAVRKKRGLETTLGAQCLMLAENIDGIPKLARDLKAIGIDYLSLKPFLPFDLLDYRTDLDLQNETVRRKLREAEQVGDDRFKVIVRWESMDKIQKRSYDRCLSAPFMLEVDSMGEVWLCGVLLGREGWSYGNIRDKSYREIVASPQYARVMERLANHDIHRCMPNCRNDAVNRFLWGLKHPPPHVNFI